MTCEVIFSSWCRVWNESKRWTGRFWWSRDRQPPVWSYRTRTEMKWSLWSRIKKSRPFVARWSRGWVRHNYVERILKFCSLIYPIINSRIDKEEISMLAWLALLSLYSWFASHCVLKSFLIIFIIFICSVAFVIKDESGAVVPLTDVLASKLKVLVRSPFCLYSFATFQA